MNIIINTALKGYINLMFNLMFFIKYLSDIYNYKPPTIKIIKLS